MTRKVGEGYGWLSSGENAATLLAVMGGYKLYHTTLEGWLEILSKMCWEVCDPYDVEKVPWGVF